MIRAYIRYEDEEFGDNYFYEVFDDFEDVVKYLCEHDDENIISYEQNWKRTE